MTSTDQHRVSGEAANPGGNPVGVQKETSSVQQRAAESEPVRPPAEPFREFVAAARPGHPLLRLAAALGRTVLTLAILAAAAVAAVLIWQYYVTAPWTRDGRVRAQVASITPQVSGQITEVRVRDNQFVRRGDVLYVIDPFDFRTSLSAAEATMRMRAADLQVKKLQAERRSNLTGLSTTVEEAQVTAGSAAQAEAMFDEAQIQVAQADIDLKRTEVRSTVNGYVTNLLLRVGDYAREGTTNISIVDTDSFWVDGYFEETKMARVCIGDRALAQLMGYAQPIVGRVETVTRGISVSNAAPSTQGLPDVDPVYTWVRLAQRVPVRIGIDHVPAGVPLVAGMTATVSVAEPAPATGPTTFDDRLERVRQTIADLFEKPAPRRDCLPSVRDDRTGAGTLSEPQGPARVLPDSLNPGLAPGMDVRPRIGVQD